MAKYYKFHYSAGYCGTDTESIVKFSDDASEREVEETFDDWHDGVNTASGSYTEISEEEAEYKGVDDDYSED